MLSLMLVAMNASTSAGIPPRCSASAFLRRMASRVSNSGGWMSVIRPHSNRVRSRSSSVAIDFGCAVGGDHDLAAFAVEVVERVEELLLELLGALEELDVVDQEHVEVAVAPLEPRHGLGADRVDELVHERLGGHVTDPLVAEDRAHVVADGVEQVGFSQPGGPVDEQRVVGPRRGSRPPRAPRRARTGSRPRSRTGRTCSAAFSVPDAQVAKASSGAPAVLERRRARARGRRAASGGAGEPRRVLADVGLDEQIELRRSRR